MTLFILSEFTKVQAGVRYSNSPFFNSPCVPFLLRGSDRPSSVNAILARGGAIEKPVVRNDELTIGHEMSATLSSDHRVIDGAMAAQYLLSMRQYIENPATLLD